MSVPPLPPISLGYTVNTLDRISHRRADDDWLAEKFNDARARTMLFAGELMVLRKAESGAEPWFTLEAAAAVGAASETVFLGLAAGEPRYAQLIPPFAAVDPNAYRHAEVCLDDPTLMVLDMRNVAMSGMLTSADLGAAGEGRALLNWHASHRFCAKCGQPSRMTQAGWRRDCPACGTNHFPRTDPVVIMLVTDGDRCLMGRQKRFPPGMYSALAGFLEPGETIADAVRREILEETAIEVGDVSYLCDQPWPFPNSLMIGAMARATSRQIVVDEEELEDARWFTREDCLGMLTKSHPARLFCPPPVAIAHHLIRAFVEGWE